MVDWYFCIEGRGARRSARRSRRIPANRRRSSTARARSAGTDLDLILRAAGIETVVVIGEQTPGCVEATFRDAAYHDYYNVLVEDCVAAFDEEQHEASLLVQRRRHDVCTAEQVLGSGERGRGRSELVGARGRSH